MRLSDIRRSVPAMNLSRPSVAAEIRAAMGRANITQSQLADRITLSPHRLSQRLNGKAPFTLDQLIEIGEALDVDPMSFLLTERVA